MPRGGLVFCNGGFMLNDLDKQTLIDNLKRQSLRLKSELDIPLNQAQLFLSRYIYQVKDLNCLKKRIKRGDLSEFVFLSAVHPNANPSFIDKFKDQFPIIILSIESSPIRERYNGNVSRLILNVFGFKNFENL